MKDYYAILGLTAEASAETIKLTYRRLALQAHPDRLSHLSPEDQAEASARMAELNEAYTVLSDKKKRTEYDLAIVRVATGAPESTAHAAAAAAAATAPQAASPPPPAQKARGRVRADEEVKSNVIGQFAQKIQGDLFAVSGMKWQVVDLDGFDWALRSGAWPNYVIAAFRGVTTLDGEQTRRFLAQAGNAVERGKRALGRDTIIFLLAFQRASERDILTQLGGRFSRATDNRAGLVVFDATHGRSLIAGKKGDAKIDAVVKGLGLK